MERDYKLDVTEQNLGDRPAHERGPAGTGERQKRHRLAVSHADRDGSPAIKGPSLLSRPLTTAAPRSSSRLAEPTVWLPTLMYDFRLVTMAQNLLPREYEEQSKLITRYCQMMTEIVEDVADVRILRRAGVVRGGSSGGQEVHEVIRNIDGSSTYPSLLGPVELPSSQIIGNDYST